MSGEALEPVEDDPGAGSRFPETGGLPVEQPHQVDRSQVGRVVVFNLVVFLGFGSILMSLLYALSDDSEGLAQWWGGVAVLAFLQFVWVGVTVEGRRRFCLAWVQIEQVRITYGVEWASGTRTLRLGGLDRWESSEKVSEALRDFSGDRWSGPPALDTG